MVMHHGEELEPIDQVDHWAIGLVVNESVHMNLNYTEQVLAVRGLRRQGKGTRAIADALRVSEMDVLAMCRRLDRQRVSRVS